MKAGKLRHRGSIQAQDDAAAQLNGETTWATFATGVWADIMPITGRQYLEGDKIESESTHNITIRFLKGVKPGMRFLYEGRLFRFDVVSNVDEKNEELRIRATEETDV